MRFVKITTDDRGGTRFEEVEVAQTTTPYAANVPPLRVSTPISATGVVFVTTPPDVRETESHPAPRRQFVVALEGELEVQTTDGDTRILAPGIVALVEDVNGLGHQTRVRTPGPATFMAIPLAE